MQAYRVFWIVRLCSIGPHEGDLETGGRKKRLKKIFDTSTLPTVRVRQ